MLLWWKEEGARCRGRWGGVIRSEWNSSWPLFRPPDDCLASQHSRAITGSAVFALILLPKSIATIGTPSNWYGCSSIRVRQGFALFAQCLVSNIIATYLFMLHVITNERYNFFFFHAHILYSFISFVLTMHSSSVHNRALSQNYM